MLKKAEKDDGSVDLPQNHVQAMKNALYVSLSYRGMNKKEVMDDSNCHLNTIKEAIIRVSEFQLVGKLEDAEKVKSLLKKNLLKRAAQISRMAHPLIDFLSAEKQAFDMKMLKIMSTKELLPKS
jgi:hypothetical protein